ncbi:helix-turn-helix domain-containing protein [Crossiella cryophila]|uniref:Transcriptional regulator with XRE-family HTH domain n=1 Tax=Crossiella cryophila TaxID=43355 RepID=A0A7W7FXR4_9PSEU|nr:helix-turn-helix domain-containing protein [Crossiella cryophila]MBB4680933.1 transcriptional regulator with XRE-family HTH domain [Crossiella cryophila]
MADNVLGGFLRARREAVTPAEVGLPAGPRRRTPGLRRGELAELAGISVEYLTRLERGSDRHPSGQVLGALADALGFTADERVHLYRLIKASTGTACAFAASQAIELRPTVRTLLDQLEPAPACVLTAHGEVLASTAGFRRLAAATGLLDEEPVNLSRFVFGDPRARAVFPDWARVADERAAVLRTAADLGDHPAAVLAEELSIMLGAEFSRRYAAAVVLPAWTGVEHWAHPEAGPLTLGYESLPLPGTDELRLLVYLPVDRATADALAALHTGAAV